MGIKGIKWIKYTKGQKINREVERKMNEESRIKQMIETDLYLIGWEVTKIMDEIKRERLVLSKLYKAG